MVVTVLLAIGFGVGLWALCVWLIPPRPPLADLVTRMRAAPRPEPLVTTDDGGWAVRLGRPFTALLRPLGLPTESVRRDLKALGRSPDTHLAEKAAAAVTGLLLPELMETALLLSGRPLPWAAPAGLSLACAVGGFLLPDLSVRSEAEKRRTAFRHALSSYLNLIHILLAGGAGVEAALHDAADTGQGWAFQQLRRALTTAHLTRTSPWSALQQLGEELGIGELTELAAALSLAGTEGSRIRASLEAKAAAMRSREGSDAEGRANAATERMSLPGVLMAVGFVIFVFYPAMVQVMASL